MAPAASVAAAPPRQLAPAVALAAPLPPLDVDPYPEELQHPAAVGLGHVAQPVRGDAGDPPHRLGARRLGQVGALPAGQLVAVRAQRLQLGLELCRRRGDGLGREALLGVVADDGGKGALHLGHAGLHLRGLLPLDAEALRPLGQVGLGRGQQPVRVREQVDHRAPHRVLHLARVQPPAPAARCAARAAVGAHLPVVADGAVVPAPARRHQAAVRQQVEAAGADPARGGRQHLGQGRVALGREHRRDADGDGLALRGSPPRFLSRIGPRPAQPVARQRGPEEGCRPAAGLARRAPEGVEPGRRLRHVEPLVHKQPHGGVHNRRLGPVEDHTLVLGVAVLDRAQPEARLAARPEAHAHGLAHAVLGALADAVALERGDHRQHRAVHASRRGRAVEALGGRDEQRPGPLNFGDGVVELAGVAYEAVDLVDHYHLHQPGPDVAQQAFHVAPLLGRSAHALALDVLARQRPAPRADELAVGPALRLQRRAVRGLGRGADPQQRRRRDPRSLCHVDASVSGVVHGRGLLAQRPGHNASTVGLLQRGGRGIQAASPGLSVSMAVSPGCGANSSRSRRRLAASPMPPAHVERTRIPA